MDTIIIADLEVMYRVGVPEKERANAQRLLVSIELAVDFRRAATVDRLGETVDYDSVCRRLLNFGENREWQLIETLSFEIAQMLLDEYSARSVTVEVKKFVIPQARYVAVRTTRPDKADLQVNEP